MDGTNNCGLYFCLSLYFERNLPPHVIAILDITYALFICEMCIFHIYKCHIYECIFNVIMYYCQYEIM